MARNFEFKEREMKKYKIAIFDESPHTGGNSYKSIEVFSINLTSNENTAKTIFKQVVEPYINAYYTILFYEIEEKTEIKNILSCSGSGPTRDQEHEDLLNYIKDKK